jgi:hypothetical protein
MRDARGRRRALLGATCSTSIEGMMPEVSMVRLTAGITLTCAASADPSRPPLVLLPGLRTRGFPMRPCSISSRSARCETGSSASASTEEDALKERLAEVDTKLAAFTNLAELLPTMVVSKTGASMTKELCCRRHPRDGPRFTT